MKQSIRNKRLKTRGNSLPLIMPMIALCLIVSLFIGCSTNRYKAALTKSNDNYVYQTNQIDYSSTSSNPKIVINVTPNVPCNYNYRIDLIQLQKKSLADYKMIANYFNQDEKWFLDNQEYLWEDICKTQNDPVLLQNSKGNIFFFSLEQNRYAFYVEEMIVMREQYLEPDEKKDFEKEPQISKEEAIRLLNQALKDLCLDDEFSIDICEHAIGYSNGIAISNGWECVLTRTSGNLQQPYCDGYTIWKNTGYPKICSPWGKEYFFVHIDERGICTWECSSIGKYVNTPYSDFELLPFSDIEHIIIKQLERQHRIGDDIKTVRNCEISVNNIELCSVLIANCTGKTGYMIPAWHIQYHLVENGFEEKTCNISEECFFISAIDGEIIEPRTTQP